MQLTLLLFDFELSETATSSMFTIVNHWKCLIFLPANTENIPKINQIKVQYNQSCCHTTYKHLNTIQICKSKLKQLFEYNYIYYLLQDHHQLICSLVMNFISSKHFLRYKKLLMNA